MNTDLLWYVMEYLEVQIMPIVVVISKEQADFLMNYFFEGTESTVENEEEFREILFNSENYLKNYKKQVKKQDKKEIQTEVQTVVPNFYRNVNFTEFEMNLTFKFSEASNWNINKVRLKLKEFGKKDKFCTLSDVKP